MAKMICIGFLLLIFFLLPVLPSGRAEADMVNGTLELDYAALESTSTGPGGNAVRTQSHDFVQQYTVNVNLNPFRTMNASGGLHVTKADGSGNSITSVQPYLDLRLQDPFSIYSAGAGYRQLKTTVKSAGGLSQTFVNDQYNTFLGWTPFELPVFSLQATRNNTYDTTRTLQDTSTDLVLFSTRYAPRKEWDLAATVSQNGVLDRLNLLETTTVIESGRANYRDTFWGRASVSAGYSIDQSATTTAQQGTGTVPFQLFPFTGYSATTDFPDPVDDLGAFPNGALIDGNRAISAGVDIGTAVSLPPDNKVREMGVDFGTVTEVNNVQIWIDQTLTTVIANSFTWNIYTSEDNTNWTLLRVVQPAAFGLFENRFSIDFQNVKTRYLKVATRPLSLVVQGATDPSYQNIFVTEMVTFLNRQAAEIRGKRSQLNQQFNLSTGTRLAEGLSHVLVYNINESATKAGEMKATSHHYRLSNGLNLTRPFKIGPTLTANARFSRDDAFDSNGNRQGLYSYAAGLTAVPLNTLRGSLQYNGALMDDGAKTDSLTLSSTADLYPGVSVSAVGGLNSGVGGLIKTKMSGNSFRASAGLIPHPTLSLSCNYATSRRVTNSTGLVSVSGSDQWDAGTSYRPFDALYLTASVSRFRGTDRRSVMYNNYGLNWSPFSGGTLLFSFGYTESYETGTDTQMKTIGPTLTWTVAPRASFTLSYFVATTTTPHTNSEVDSLFGQFKMTF